MRERPTKAWRSSPCYDTAITVKSTFVDPAIQEYIIANVVREHPALMELREETARHPQARMQIGPEQGGFMQLLARSIGARRYLEIGVFTGYSGLAMALALPDDGHAAILIGHVRARLLSSDSREVITS